ncbi:hypothetical protein [Streptomyces sp. x-80]
MTALCPGGFLDAPRAFRLRRAGAGTVHGNYGGARRRARDARLS